MYSQSESCTKQCLQQQKPANKHMRVYDPPEPAPSPANRTGNRTVLHFPLQMVDFEAALLQQLFILKGKFLLGKFSL